MYGDVAMEHAEFEDLLEAHKDGVLLDTELDADDSRRWSTSTRGWWKRLGEPFPQDPKDQLWGAVSAVFGSWQTARAVTYRRLHDIPEDWGTAVNVQAMVFGNMGDDCATGVAFTRDPSTGENTFYGEYLVNAQGEDVVAGIRTPQQLTIAGKEAQGSRLPSMEETMPEVFGQLDTSARSWSSTTRTCRTSSSRSRRGGSTCCRRARVSARRRQPFGLPWRWRKRA